LHFRLDLSLRDYFFTPRKFSTLAYTQAYTEVSLQLGFDFVEFHFYFVLKYSLPGALVLSQPSVGGVGGGW
jgi:hypothetical protein